MRFDITAHSLGIEAIVKAAQARLKRLSEHGVRFPDEAWAQSFRREEIKPTAPLCRARFLFSLTESKMVRWFVGHSPNGLCRK